MTDPNSGSPTNAAESDAETVKEIAALIRSPELIGNLGDDELVARIQWYLSRLARLRMGGRSSALPGLAVLLWCSAERWPNLEPQLPSVEALLAVAFRAAFDPSFVTPEWAVVVAGVLLDRYRDRIKPTNVSKEVHAQCLRLLRHLEESPETTLPARNAAAALIAEQAADFPRGVAPVVDAAVAGWPSTEPVAQMDDEHVSNTVAILVNSLPTQMTEDERRIYRLYLERQGLWDIFASSTAFSTASSPFDP